MPVAARLQVQSVTAGSIIHVMTSSNKRNYWPRTVRAKSQFYYRTESVTRSDCRESWRVKTQLAFTFRYFAHPGFFGINFDL